MAKKFKFIIAVLVFMGLFSSVQASQYIDSNTFQEGLNLMKGDSSPDPRPEPKPAPIDTPDPSNVDTKPHNDSM